MFAPVKLLDNSDDILLVSTAPEVMPRAVDAFLSQYGSLCRIRLFHYLRPGDALVVLEQPESETPSAFKCRVAECTACTFDGSTDTMLFYSTATARRSINDQYFTRYSDLYFLILKGISPQRYEDMMKIDLRYQKIHMEFPVDENETVGCVQARLVDAGVLSSTAKVRFLLIAGSRLERILSIEDRIVNEKHDLKIEDISEDEEAAEGDVLLLVSIATLDRGTISCYGDPFVLKLIPDETASDLRARVAQRLLIDPETVSLGLLESFEFLSDVRFLSTAHRVIDQLLDDYHLFVITKR
jgi:hypothetical protein